MTPRPRRISKAWLFVAPALAVFSAFALLPILQALRLSFFRWGGARPEAAWRGLGNYAEAFGDGVFWRAVLHNLLLAAASIMVQIPLALFLAVLLAAPLRGRWIFHTAYFAPMVLPTAVIAIFWSYALDANGGLALPLARLLGASGEGLLGEARTAFATVFAVISWRYVGFHMVILLAGVLAVPGELYEAAALDGAGALARFRHVTLPGVRGALAVSALLSVVGSIKYFDLVYILTAGGPDHATELGATWIYTTGIAEGQRWGYGSALAVLLLALAMAAAVPALLARQRREVAA